MNIGDSRAPGGGRETERVDGRRSSERLKEMEREIVLGRVVSETWGEDELYITLPPLCNLMGVGVICRIKYSTLERKEGRMGERMTDNDRERNGARFGKTRPYYHFLCL